MAEQESISIKVRSQAGDEVTFKVKPSTKFQKIFIAYADKKGLDFSSIRFLFDGQGVTGEKTPSELGMEDGDIVDVMFQQIGGF